MKVIIRTASFVMFILSMSCGGRVVPDSETDESEARGPDASDPDSGSRFGDVPLGTCQPELEPGEPCDWFVDTLGKCYATRDQACGCACPRDRDSTCVSGFYAGPDARTSVSCF